MKAAKRRALSFILAVVTLATAVPFQSFSVQAAEPVYGDANGDGRVDLKDVLLIEEYLKDPNTSIEKTCADVNGNGQIEEDDAQAIRDYLVGNRESLKPELCTVSFDAGEGGSFPSVTVGRGYTLPGELPVPAMDGMIFSGWLLPDGSPFYQDTTVIEEDLVLTADYEPMKQQLEETLSIDSFTLNDQAADLAILVEAGEGAPADLASGITLVATDGRDPVALSIIPNGDGTCTVTAAEGFTPGGSYELTLADGINFYGKDPMYRTLYFNIAKPTEDGLVFAPNLQFIQDTEEMDYTVNGTVLPMLQTALISTGDSSQEIIRGTFTMPAATAELETGDKICIYETVSPRERDYTVSDYEGDDYAYLKITAADKSGSVPVYTFESIDETGAEEVLAAPDTIPYQVETLPSGSVGTVDKNEYDHYGRAMLGMEEEPEFAVYDILVFYTEPYETLTEESPRVYGQITDVQEDLVTYKLVSMEEIEDFNSMYVKQHVSGEELLSQADEQTLLASVMQQTEESGFTEEAVHSMVASYLENEEGQKQLLTYGMTEEEIQAIQAQSAELTAIGMYAAAGGVKVNVEDLTVIPNIGKSTYVKDGVKLTLDVTLTLSVEKKIKTAGKSSQLKIELYATFEQEVGFDIKVDVSTKWKKILFIPILKEIYCGVQVDIGDYSYVHLGAKAYTVSEGLKAKKWKALADCYRGQPITRMLVRQVDRYAAKLQKLDKKTPEYTEVETQLKELKDQLNNEAKIVVEDQTYTIEMLEADLEAQGISTQFADILGADSSEETKIGVQQLVDRYTELMDQDSDWVELFEQQIVDQEIHIKVVAISLEVSVVARANVNISIGAEVEYQVGKRYNFWVKCFEKTSGSSEQDILDERFGFQFYAMGKLGIRVGIKAQIGVGIISTKIASVGASVEFGLYLKVYGYFFYVFNRVRPQNTNRWNETEECQGAMCLEFGIYLTVKFKAQALKNTFKYEPTLYDHEFPLLTVGEKENVYQMVVDPGEDDILYINDEDANAGNGITMQLPKFYRYMKVLNLSTGVQSLKLCDLSKFKIRFSNPNFRIDENGTITVTPPLGSRYEKTDMHITYKCGKLAFSLFDIDITAPVVWTDLSDAEIADRFTITVAAGSAGQGYTPVWTTQANRVEPFDLPSEEEILTLCGYDNFDDGTGYNLKYASKGSYTNDATTGLYATADMTYYYELPERVYSLTVNGIKNPDGSERTASYTALYGGDFDLSDLSGTGSDTDTENLAFDGVADSADEKLSLTQTVDWGYASRYGTSAEVTAQYRDTRKTATFVFQGVSGISDLKVSFKSGEAPSGAGLQNHVGDSYLIKSVEPAIEKSLYDVTYTVTCVPRDPARPIASHQVSFDRNDGTSKVSSYRYAEGSVIYPPSTPSRGGYTFLGWYYDKECTVPFADGTVMGETDLTLYAGWTEKEFQVTLKSGTETVAVKTVRFGDVYGTLTAPEKQAAVRFVGYYTGPNGTGTRITEATRFTGFSDQTLYAAWEAKKSSASMNELNFGYGNNTYEYGDCPWTFRFTISSEDGFGSINPETDFTIWYRSAGSNGNYTTEAPSEVGTYTMKVKFNGNDEFLPGNEIVINHAQLTIERGRIIMGKLKFSVYMTNLDFWSTIDLPEEAVWASSGKSATAYLEQNRELAVLSYKLKDAPENTWKTITRSNTDYYSYINLDLYETLPDLQMKAGQERNGTYYAMRVTYEDDRVQPVTSELLIMRRYQNLPEESTEEDSVSYNYKKYDFATGKITDLQYETGDTNPDHQVGMAVPETGTKPLVQFVSAAGGSIKKAVLTAEAVQAARGKTIELPVNLTENDGVWGLLGCISYDSDAFTLTGIKTGNGTVFTPEEYTLQKDDEANPYRFLATRQALSDTGQTGIFLVLQFAVNEKAREQSYTMELKVLQAIGSDAEEVIASSGNGMVTVAASGEGPGSGGTKPGTGSEDPGSGTKPGSGSTGVSASPTGDPLTPLLWFGIMLLAAVGAAYYWILWRCRNHWKRRKPR